ncbi:MAG: hypothetical protein K2X41_12330 [Hyphomicrobium sp.]|nr:hypothetical protein [Hyphomicrobium sp.]
MSTISKIYATTAFIAMAVAGQANAAVVSGTISKMDMARHTITVGRHVYNVGPKLDASALKQGQSVRLSYRSSRGHRVATRILAPARGKVANASTGKMPASHAASTTVR